MPTFRQVDLDGPTRSLLLPGGSKRRRLVAPADDGRDDRAGVAGSPTPPPDAARRSSAAAGRRGSLAPRNSVLLSRRPPPGDKAGGGGRQPFSGEGAPSATLDSAPAAANVGVSTPSALLSRDPKQLASILGLDPAGVSRLRSNVAGGLIDDVHSGHGGHARGVAECVAARCLGGMDSDGGDGPSAGEEGGRPRRQRGNSRYASNATSAVPGRCLHILTRKTKTPFRYVKLEAK